MTEKPLIELVGSWSCCDVWLTSPATGTWQNSTLKLYGTDGKARVNFHGARPADSPGVVASSLRQQLVLSVRGRPCDGFIVTATSLPVSEVPAPAQDAEIVIEAWGSDTASQPTDHDRIAIAQALPTHGSSAASGVRDQWLANSGATAAWRASVTSSSVAVAYLQIFDRIAALGGGEVPIDVAEVDAGKSVTIAPPRGLRCSTGLMLGLSSRPDQFAGVAQGIFGADLDSLV